MVRLGSTSATARLSSGSSVLSGTSVTSIAPPMKCEFSSSFLIIASL